MKKEKVGFFAHSTLILQVSGHFTFETAGQSISMRAGEMLLVRKNQLGEITKTPLEGENYETIVIVLQEDLLRKIALEEQIEIREKYTGPSNLLIPGNDFLRGYFQSVIPYVRTTEEKIVTALGMLKVKEGVQLLLRAQPGLKGFLFDFSESYKIDLEKFMLSNFHFNVPVERFAQLTGRSLAGFKRDFQKIFVMSPRQWLQERRLAEARHLMMDLSLAEKQIHRVTSFQDLISTSFSGETNAICWSRKLIGDFSEIVKKIELRGNITTIEQEELCELKLSEQGQLARKILLNDLEKLRDHGASPILNIINYYDRDDTCLFLPTDVYSFHVDRSPIAIDTFLCTYCGESSEILPNSQGKRKVLIPEIRDELKKLYHGADEGFESFLSEHFFDLHYQAQPNARTISLGLGHLWKLAVDHPESQIPPCIHRAPKEKSGQNRLLLIC